MTRSNSPYDQVPNWHYKSPAGNDQVGDGQVEHDWRRGTEDENYLPHSNDACGRDDILTAALHDTDYPAESEQQDRYRADRLSDEGEDPILDIYYRLAQSIQTANPHLIAVPFSSPHGHSPYELPPARPTKTYPLADLEFFEPHDSPELCQTVDDHQLIGLDYPAQQSGMHNPSKGEIAAEDVRDRTPLITSQYDLPGTGRPRNIPTRNWDFDTTYYGERGSNRAQPIDQDAFRSEVDGIEHGALALHGEAWAENADDDYEYEGGNPNRKFMIAGPLISAIVVGSGLLFGYNTLFSIKSNESAPSAVKADLRPAKVQPADHDGRNFQHTNGKLMKKLGGDHAAGRAASADTVGDTTSRVRSVSTFVVGRDGRLILPGATQRSSVAAAGPGPSKDLPDLISPLPGMIIIGGPPIQPSALGARTIKPSGRTGHERITQPAPSPTTTKVAQ